MTRHDESLRLKHMLAYAVEAVKMAQGKQRSDLDQERMLELSLVRLIEIVGEAATRVNESTKVKYPSIPWVQIAGMRNRLVHGYDQVDLDVLWDTVQDDLPTLIAELSKILLPHQGGQ